MFGICLESSHERGMGHLYRQLHFSSLLAQKKEPFVFFINNDKTSLKILTAENIPHQTVPLNDYGTGWEKQLVEKYHVTTWVDDRMDTDQRHARFVKDSGARLVVFDDRGSGAALADFNFSALSFEETSELSGKQVFTGTDYLILNREIDSYKRRRTRMDKLLVTLGGSDTYGVTIKIVNILKSIDRAATVMLGPSFAHRHELEEAADSTFEIKSSVKSLIAEFAHYDLAICGGGITPFEANASGLPCIIIANEHFEIANGHYLERLGSSLFAGYHKTINADLFKTLPPPNLSVMSQAGLSRLDTKGAQRIWDALQHV